MSMTKTKTKADKAREAAAERERAARRKRAADALAALPEATRASVMDLADDLEATARGTKKRAPEASVAYLERALSAHAIPTAGKPAKKAAEPRRPKGPREKSTPKEAGRPKPETKDPEALAANAKTAREAGRSSIEATVHVTVPTGEAYCASCDTNKPEPEFWPAKVTDKSRRRKICRECYNREWREWDAKRRETAGAK